MYFVPSTLLCMLQIFQSHFVSYWKWWQLGRQTTIYRMKERRTEKDGSFPSPHAFCIWEYVKHSAFSKQVVESNEMLGQFALFLSKNVIIAKTPSLHPDWCSSVSQFFWSKKNFLKNYSICDWWRSHKVNGELFQSSDNVEVILNYH